MKRSRNYFIAATLVAGGLALAVVATRSLRPTPAASPDHATAAAAHEEIAWLTDFDAALAKARKTGQPIMVDFFATWCPPCRMLDTHTYRDARVVAASREYLMVRIDVDKQGALAERFQVSSIPTIVVMRPDGKVAERSAGFVGPEEMLSLMQTPAARS